MIAEAGERADFHDVEFALGRERVVGGGVVHGGHDHRVVHGEAGDARGAFNNVAHARQRHGLQRKFLERRGQRGRFLKLAEIIRAQRHEHEEGQVFML